MTTIYLIRHGEIDANVSQCWHGWTDSELNQRGRVQAQKMGLHLAAASPDISCVYTSPLKRTLVTAQSLSNRLQFEPRIHDGLKEYGIGHLEGQPYQALQDDHQFFDLIARDQDYAPPEGESVNQVYTRMLGALEEIRANHMGETLAVVSHGAALAITLAGLLDGAPIPFHHYHMANTAITKLVWRDSPAIEFFNARDHWDG